MIARAVEVLLCPSMQGFQFVEVTPNLRHSPSATVREEDARLALLRIETVIMERQLSQELTVIDLQGESLEAHIVFHSLLVALVGQAAATMRAPRFSLQLHLVHTSSPLIFRSFSWAFLVGE